MNRPIVDERTLAGYLIGPTELRAREIEVEGGSAFIRFADVEEHAIDPGTHRTLRCDLTLRTTNGALVSAELKRPEVMTVDAHSLKQDAFRKAVSRGFTHFLTCNIKEVALWSTEAGPYEPEPIIRQYLSKELSESYYAPRFREDISKNWRQFLDECEPLLQQAMGEGENKRPLPPHIDDLREAIITCGKDAGIRLRDACRHDEIRNSVLSAFRNQFGVDMQLDPEGPIEKYENETEPKSRAVNAFSLFI